MKIVLVSFSQDTNILNPDESESYIVVGEEESGQVTRVPVPIETIQAIAVFVAQVQGEIPQGAQEQTPEELEEEKLEEQAEEDLGAPEGTVPYQTAIPPPQRRLVRPVRNTRSQFESTGDAEEKVPPL